MFGRKKDECAQEPKRAHRVKVTLIDGRCREVIVFSSSFVDIAASVSACRFVHDENGVAINTDHIVSIELVDVFPRAKWSEVST